MKKMDSLLSIAETLSHEELEMVSLKILNLLKGELCQQETEQVKDAVYECRKCGMASGVIKYGKDKNGIQRYKCKNCNTVFVATSYSVVSKTHYDLAVWEKYIQTLLNGLSLVKCANICKISVRTAFVWRHKILSALQQDQDTRILGGIVETDETYVSISYKGNHKNSKHFTMPREAFKRGSDSRSQIGSRACVMCAYERNGQSYGEVLGKGQPTIAMLSHAFDNRLLDDTLVISDKAVGIKNYFKRTDKISLIQLMAHVKPKSMGSPPEVRGAYHIQNVNNMHARFHRFLKPYNGVATKYLNHYLNLFIWIENHKKIENVKLDSELSAYLKNKNTYISSNSLVLLPPIPKVA